MLTRTKPLSLLLLAILFPALQSQGQIAYTNLEPDEVVFSDGFVSEFYNLDLDGDGSTDFLLQAAVDAIPPFEQIMVTPQGGTSNAVASPGGTSSCCELFGDPFANKFLLGQLIGPALTWNTTRVDIDCDACGNWSLGETAFLGLRVGSGITARYGWLRVQQLGGASAILLDYAVQLTPATPIAAGNPGLCQAPNILRSESLDGTRAEVEWDPVPGALSYVHSWRAVGGGPVFSDTSSSTTGLMEGLSPNTRYRVSAQAICITDTSILSPSREFGTSNLPVPGEVREINRLTPGIDLSNPTGLGSTISLGKSFAVVGDMDGDGRNEIASATGFVPLSTPGGFRILFPGGDSIKAVTNPGLPFAGAPVDIDDIVGIGDVDGNGVTDIAVSEDLTGAVWIFRMNSSGLADTAFQLALDGVPVNGGDEMAAIGDLNADGIPDLAVRAFDGIRFFLLDATGQAFLSRSLTGTGFFDGGSFEGIAGLGDVDGDGVGDIAVGDGLDDTDDVNAGAVYVVLMNADGTAKSSQKLTGTTSGKWIDNQSSDVFGRSVAGVGDIDGDGIPDLAVGAAQDSDPFTESGSVLLIALNADGSLKSSRKLADGRNGLSLGLIADDRFGEGIDLIGDTDGDGLLELAVGAPRADRSGSNTGSIYLLEIALPQATCAASEDARVDSVIATGVRLEWSAVPDALSYDIEGRRLGGSPQTANRTSTGFSRTGLLPSTGYAWRIRSVCASGASAWTPLDTFFTPALRSLSSATEGPRGIFPNPSIGRVVVQGPAEGGGRLVVWNSNGQRMAEMPWTGERLELNASDWPAGLYRLQWLGDDEQSEVLGTLMRP
jgi:hypothetical protein